MKRPINMNVSYEFKGMDEWVERDQQAHSIASAHKGKSTGSGTLLGGQVRDIDFEFNSALLADRAAAAFVKAGFKIVIS